MSTYTEDNLVEQPAIQLIRHELGWDVVNCYGEWDGGVSELGRDGKREVGRNIEHRTPNIEHRSEEKGKIRLNPDLPVEAIEGAVEEICRDRTALSLAEANREIDKLLKQGVKVSFPDPEHGGQRVSFHGTPAFHGGMKLPCFMNPSPSPLRNSSISSSGEIGHFSEIACHFLLN